MPISYKKTVAVLQDYCTIEEAETLLEWLLEHPKAKLNLKQLEHLHTAVLQVIMALQPAISAMPDDIHNFYWLEALLRKTV